MRIRCGGNVIEVDRFGLVVFFAACTALLVLTVFSIGMVGVVRSRGHDDQADDDRIEPTPIDKLLKKVMEDKRLDNAASDGDADDERPGHDDDDVQRGRRRVKHPGGNGNGREPEEEDDGAASNHGRRRRKASGGSQKKRHQVLHEQEEVDDNLDEIDRPLKLPQGV